jgi:hypothetical protein
VHGRYRIYVRFLVALCKDCKTCTTLRLTASWDLAHSATLRRMKTHGNAEVREVHNIVTLNSLAVKAGIERQDYS